jgi:hypothetical protein
MPLTDLETLRDRIEDQLKDAGNADWTTGELDNALRVALAELSTVCPARAVATVDAVAGQREYSLAAISGLQGVVEVWYPYLSTDAELKKPHPVKWRMLTDSVLFLDVDEDPDATYDLRVFYDKVQTVAGLDSAAATTVNEAEKAALVLGAAGYAATGRAVYLTDRVSVGGAQAVERLADWGRRQVGAFQQRIYALGQRDAAEDDARVGWWSADKWDEE